MCKNITIGETLNNEIINDNLSNINENNKMPLVFEKSVKFNLNDNNTNNNNSNTNNSNTSNTNNANDKYEQLQLSINKILENRKILNLLSKSDK